MKKRTRTYLGLALALAALAAGGTAIVPAPAGAQGKVVVWNFPHISAPTYYHTVNYSAFAAKVKEKSQGRMEIRFHPASSLYPGPELIPALLDDGRALAQLRRLYCGSLAGGATADGYEVEVVGHRGRWWAPTATAR